jgi:hypothetical protein
MVKGIRQRIFLDQTHQDMMTGMSKATIGVLFRKADRAMQGSIILIKPRKGERERPRILFIIFSSAPAR